MHYRTIIAAVLITMALVAGLWRTGSAQVDPIPTVKMVHPLFERALPRVAEAGFHGVVSAPSNQVSLLDGLSIISAGLDSTYGVVETQRSYRITLGRLGEGESAAFFGSVGTAGLERAKSYNQPTADCSAEAPYCAFPGVGDRLTSELFRGYTAGDQPLLISHIICCNGEYWNLNWYQPDVDMSYGIVFTMHVAHRVGANGVTPNNSVYAQQLADFVTDLIRLSV
jgi:hypothetical protein